jgi:hypothetical protein
MHLLAVFLASFKIEIAGLDFHRRLNIPTALGHTATESQTHSPLHTVGGASQSRIRIQLSSLAFVSLFAPRPSAKISTALRPLATNQAHPADPVGTPNRHYVDLSPGTAHGVRRTFRALSCNK